VAGNYSWARLASGLDASCHWAFVVARPAYPAVAGAGTLARDPWMMFVPWGEVCGAAASCPEASFRYSGACHAVKFRKLMRCNIKPRKETVLLLQGTCCYVLWCAVAVAVVVAAAVAVEAAALLNVEQVDVAAREEPSLASSMNLQGRVVMPSRSAAAPQVRFVAIIQVIHVNKFSIIAMTMKVPYLGN
jgi:hypothetical protein